LGQATRPWTGQTRETRQGWSLLTVESEVNEDSKNINEKCPSLVGSFGLSFQYQRFLYALAALVGTGQNIFSSDRVDKPTPK
jgi:hypothetical protein